ncbi:hypothetical protein GIB67_038620 [Kingdonia uniflora]|uniref:Aminotransferase-like plant mobile domain-containing protein n=1 Tax=Kingdonia uniflora TaxID=39325 RepID=A0A7J7NPT7_9MAGN|nr:hypothetical protein GIB67_038620 [Kingdonia uniflora]
MGFANFCSINAGNSDNRLIHALVERWWPSTHTFHFPCGELGFTLLDLIMLTGISFGRGRELPYDKRYSKLEKAEKMFPGITSSDMRYGVYEIETSRGRSCFSDGHPEGSIDVSPIRPRYALVFRRPVYTSDDQLDSVPYNPLQEIIKFPRYDRELYQSQKDVDFYDGRDYLVLDVDYMTYWRLIHPNPKIGCTLVKRTGNFWSVGRDLVRPDVILPPTSSLATSSQVQDYGVQATGDPRDMEWFMDVAGPNDQRGQIPIPVMKVSYPCPPMYSTDELRHQNQGLRYTAYEESRQLTDSNIELRRELSRAQEVIREAFNRLAEMSISYQTKPVVQCT